MHIYRGERREGRCTVTRDGEPLDLERSLAVWAHSPDGWQWGYHGSGPAQLALALCLECCCPELAIALHQPLKRNVVARWKGDAWTLSSSELLAWLAERPDLTGAT